MNDSEQFDDELLSAYLDDELAAAERARVEERLAGDPAARKLLDELRAVSGAVKAMPQEPLKADLRETVLRQSERAMLVSASGRPAAAGEQSVDRRDEAARFSIGRSKRGWFWAGLAVAAAVMLMVYRPGPERNPGLPGVVAARSEESADADDGPADRLELRALEENLPTAGSGLAVSSPASTSGAPADDTPATPESHAAMVESRFDVRSGRAGGGGFGGAIAESDADEVDLLVVNLLVKPVVFEQKMFEATLVRNNIAIEEPEAAPAESLSRDARLRDELAGELRTGDRRDSSAPPSSSESEDLQEAEGMEGVEVVIVEATPDLIMPLLQDIYSDENYIAIHVEDQLTASKKLAANEKVARESQEFNRGWKSPRPKLERAPAYGYYLQTDGGQIAFGRDDAGKFNFAQEKSLAKEVTNKLKQGWARQLAAKRTKLGFGDESARERKAGLAQRGVVNLPKGQADMLQVLFVLQAGEEPAAEGLQNGDR